MNARMAKRMKQPIFWVKCVMTVAVLAGGCWLFCFFVDTMNPSGMRELPYTYVSALKVERTAKNGSAYTVNNSMASFFLDVELIETAHDEKLFPSYAKALDYCEKNQLPWIPSVQMIRWKLKSFDDSLVAAIEVRLQRGHGNVLGKSRLLEKLLAQLLTTRKHYPTLQGLDTAIIYVGAAHRLGGGEAPEFPKTLEQAIRNAIQHFHSDPTKSKVVGFWTSTPELKTIFLQDRFLAQGFTLYTNVEAAVVLSTIVSRDHELKHGFDRHWKGDAVRTNPPCHLGSDQLAIEKIVSPNELAILIGAEPLHVLLSAASVSIINGSPWKPCFYQRDLVKVTS